MSQTKKSLQDLTLLDRFLFAEVMEDAETFENVLSIILGQDISIKGHPQSEHEKRTSPLKRQVRLDVWAEDDTDAVYNIEAQKEKLEAEGHTIIQKGRTNIKYFVKDYESVLFDLR